MTYDALGRTYDSKLIHVAGRPYRRRQKCRRCGYVFHDWGAKTDWPPEGNDHYWKAGAEVIVALAPPGYRTSYRLENAPAKFRSGAEFCGAHNTGKEPDA